jgi:thioesterase domain-containing protein
VSQPAVSSAQATHSGTPRPARSIPDAFRATVAEHADRLAVRDGDRSVTYGELDGRPLRAYRPLEYPGRTLVFASPRYFEDAGPVLDELMPPESAGGRRRDVPVHGEHLDVVREPNGADVARALDLVLRAGGPGSPRP